MRIPFMYLRSGMIHCVQNWWVVRPRQECTHNGKVTPMARLISGKLLTTCGKLVVDHKSRFGCLCTYARALVPIVFVSETVSETKSH